MMNFEQRVDISNYVTLFPDKAEKGTRELDLTDEELEKNFYTGDSIDLAKLLCDEIVLFLPFNPRCSENCKGLCPSCGKKLSEGNCDCAGIEGASPFSILKDVKF